MHLYLIRHAEAAAKEVDVARNLTEQGAADAQRLGKILGSLQLEVDEIWHSGKPRAVQTAEHIASSIRGGDRMVFRPGLAPYDRVKPVARDIQRAAANLMIVGHEPFLGRLASRLVAGRASIPVVALDKPSVVCLGSDPVGTWRIEWMLSPKLFPQDQPAHGAEPQPSENPDG